ncbi:hypothetical protein ACFLSE_09650 [Bacteroidota bacterium]
MKNLFIIVILLLITFLNSIGQVERKSKTQKYEPFKEKYTVLKNDKKVKDGPFILFFENDTLVSGFYKNNNKDSVWTYYNSIGEIELKYNFNENKLVYWNKHAKVDYVRWTQMNIEWRRYKWSSFFPADSSFLEKKYTIYKNGEEMIVELDRPPLFKEGSFQLQMVLSSIIKKMDIDWNYASQCLISFKIDEKGNALDYNIELSSNQDYEKKFLQLLEQKSLKWIPGELNGEFVSCKYKIPICTLQELEGNITNFSFLVFKERTFLNYINLVNFGKENYKSILWTEFRILKTPNSGS